MTVMHPMSAMKTARVAARFVHTGLWAHLNRIEARDIVARMERLAIWGPAEGSHGARLLDAHARRLAALAVVAQDEFGLPVGHADLDWLLDPARMDQIERAAFQY